MIKCRCIKCGDEKTYESQKGAWMDGWDFIGGKNYCGNCPVMPFVPEKNEGKSDE